MNAYVEVERLKSALNSEKVTKIAEALGDIHHQAVRDGGMREEDVVAMCDALARWAGGHADRRARIQQLADTLDGMADDIRELVA